MGPNPREMEATCAIHNRKCLSYDLVHSIQCPTLRDRAAWQDLKGNTEKVHFNVAQKSFNYLSHYNLLLLAR